jgi:pimeloyl-ACP methyl ester carboxylesterase
MQALFVHGMGRSPLSAIPLLRRLRQAGLSLSWMFYMVTFEDFSTISKRLQKKILTLAAKDDYILIGHSLGGVLIRDALASLPPGTRMPKHLFLLGSPVRPSRFAQMVRRRWLYRLITRDCGQLLASEERMAGVAPSSIPTTSIVGTYCYPGFNRLFGSEENDSIVSCSEVAADWISEVVPVPVSHTFLTSNRCVSKAIVERVTRTE